MDTNDGRREMRRVDWDFVPEAVVVGNGEFPVSALPLRMLDTASFTVCCDGAADRYLASGRVPDRIVGDGDSLSVENQKRYARAKVLCLLLRLKSDAGRSHGQSRREPDGKS